jgi:hypothetical protein
MRLYSKYYAGKSVSWRDSQGNTWVMYPDPLTGEVFYVGSTGEMVDGYGAEFTPYVIPGTEGQPDQGYAWFEKGINESAYSDYVIEYYEDDELEEDEDVAPMLLVPIGFVYGAQPVRDLFELEDEVAEELLADSGIGAYFVPWRPAPRAPKRRKKVSSS